MNTRTRTIASFFSVAMAATLLGAVVTTQMRPEAAQARPAEPAADSVPRPSGPVTLETFRAIARLLAAAASYLSLHEPCGLAVSVVRRALLCKGRRCAHRKHDAHGGGDGEVLQSSHLGWSPYHRGLASVPSLVPGVRSLDFAYLARLTRDIPWVNAGSL